MEDKGRGHPKDVDQERLTKNLWSRERPIPGEANQGLPSVIG